MNKDLKDAWRLLQEALDVLDQSKCILDQDMKYEPRTGMFNDDPIIVYGDVVSDYSPRKLDGNQDDFLKGIFDELNALFPERSISYDVPDYDPDQVDLETEIIYNELIDRISK